MREPAPAAMPSLEKLGAPPEVAAAVGKLRDELLKAPGAGVIGLILYGGLARGRWRAGRSDVNLVVLLEEASASALRAIAPALREAARDARVAPSILTLPEARYAADVFPLEILDIRDHHLVLFGQDPFREIAIPAEPLRLHVEQGLRDLARRLRRRFIEIHDDPAELAAALARAARPLAILLGGLLRVLGKAPSEDRTLSVFRAAAAAFDLDREALERLAALRRDPQPAADLAEVYPRVLEAISHAAEMADRLEGVG